MANYNGKSEKVKARTFGPNYYNAQALEKLSIKYDDNSAIITISKLKNKNDSLVEDETNSIELFVRPYTLSTLASEADDILSDIKKDNTFDTAGIPCGRDHTSLIEISNGSNIGRQPGIYLVIYKNLKEDRTTDEFMVYTFATRMVVKGYNAMTGAGDVIINKSQEYKEFVKLLLDYSSAMNMTLAHSFKEATKFDKLSNTRVLSLICANMGIDLTSNGNSYKPSNYKKKDRFASNISEDDNIIDLDDTDYTVSEVNLDIDLDD